MGRLGSLALISTGILAAAPAGAAEVTRVLSSGDPDSPFAASVEVRVERTQRSAKITREFGDNQGGTPVGVVRDEAELKYTQATDRVVPRIAFGIWRDLELRLAMPYVVDDTPTWNYAAGVNAPPPGYPSAIDSNTIDASGADCGGPCRMFPAQAKLRAGMALDDLTIGVAWGILNERRDEFSPTWVVSLDVTAPTAARYDPAAGRLDAVSFFASPVGGTKKAAVGHKIWVYDLATAVSKRVGRAEPYIKANVRISQKSSSTYSNCEHAADLLTLGQMSSAAPANCADPYWKKRSEADPPLAVGLLAGAELTPFEEPASGRRLSIDLRLGSEFYTAGRWYNELTPATGKLLANDAYFTVRAGTALSYATRHSRWALGYTFEHDFAHFITGEPMGHVSNELVTPNGPQQNPNFDFRYDLPGRRFRVADTMVHIVSLELAVVF